MSDSSTESVIDGKSSGSRRRRQEAAESRRKTGGPSSGHVGKRTTSLGGMSGPRRCPADNAEDEELARDSTIVDVLGCGGRRVVVGDGAGPESRIYLLIEDRGSIDWIYQAGRAVKGAEQRENDYPGRLAIWDDENMWPNIDANYAVMSERVVEGSKGACLMGGTQTIAKNARNLDTISVLAGEGQFERWHGIVVDERGLETQDCMCSKMTRPTNHVAGMCPYVVIVGSRGGGPIDGGANKKGLMEGEAFVSRQSIEAGCAAGSLDGFYPVGASLSRLYRNLKRVLARACERELEVGIRLGKLARLAGIPVSAAIWLSSYSASISGGENSCAVLPCGSPAILVRGPVRLRTLTEGVYPEKGGVLMGAGGSLTGRVDRLSDGANMPHVTWQVAQLEDNLPELESRYGDQKVG